tara:strand:+ start:772 stop:1047 length:276 start_codon:yes stop_codon:yes gene_type:complete
VNIHKNFKDTSGDKVRLYNYPYNKKWELIYSNEYIYFRRLHTLITKKTDVDKNEICDELLRIKTLAKYHEYPNFMPIWLMKIYQLIKNFKF